MNEKKMHREMREGQEVKFPSLRIAGAHCTTGKTMRFIPKNFEMYSNNS